MARKALDTLTEPMFYVLMAFYRKDMCGTEIADYVKFITLDRIRIGPGTLYTILGEFQKADMIEAISRDGRRITYSITDKGRQAYQKEIRRLEQCLRDANDETTCRQGGDQ